MRVANKIDAIQHECGVRDYDLVDELHFGLVHVVYEWAKGTVGRCTLQLLIVSIRDATIKLNIP